MRSRAGEKRGKILYVATNSEERDHFRGKLEREGEFTIQFAGGVEEALATLDGSNHIDCVVSEYELPEIDGIAFFQTVRTQHPELPFILFTDAGSEAVASRAITAGVTDYLTKDRAEGEWDHVATLIAQAIEYHDRRRPVSDPELTVRAVLEATPDATVVVQNDSFLYVDSDALDLFGADSQSDFDGIVPTDLLAAEARALTADMFEAIQSGHRHVDRSEQTVVSLDGSPTPVELTATGVTWNDERAVLLISRDISSRKSRKAELQRFRRAAEAAGHAIYITDPEGTITYVNPAFEKVTGYDATEAVGRNPRILNSGEMPENYFDELWETVTAGRTWEEEVINERKNGEQYHARQTIAPISGDDEILAYVAIQTDITEQKQREERLQYYKQAIESSTDMLSAVDADYRYLFANAQYREFHGLSAEEVTETVLSDVLSDEEFAEIRPRVDRAFKGESINYELTRASAEGVERHLSIQLFPLPPEKGKIRGVGAAIRDITERRQREERVGQLSELRRVIHKINQRLVRANDKEELLPKAADIISTSDLFECTFVSLLDDEPEFVCQSDSELDMAAIRDFHTREYVNSVFDEGLLWMEDVTEPPFVQHHQERLSHVGLGLAISHEGEKFGILTVHFPPDVQPADEEVELLQNVASDIGFFLHSQEMEYELETFREIAERIDDPVMLQDAEGRFQVVNEAVAEFAGMSKEALMGATESAFMDEESAAFVEEMKGQVLHHEEPTSYQITPEFPENGNSVFSTMRFPHYDEDGNVDGTVAICRDVTDLKEHQRQLQVIDRVLRHNVNNDMNVIQGFASMIRNEAGGEMQEYAEKILDNSEKLLTTTDKEREITSVLADPPPKETIEISRPVKTTIERIRNRYPNAEISIDFNGNCTVRATAALNQAIEELLDNAISHADTDNPSVEVRCERVNDEVLLHVADDGPGIPELERGVLTEGATIDPLYHGSGLGLWLVNLIVQQADGTVKCEANDPRGTVVTLALPIQ